MEFIDLRSDTVTQPTQQMRQAVFTTGYGDWAYNEDDVVKSLQKRAASIFGKQDAAFVLSGTFGNQASLNAVGNPGQEILIASKSHIVRYENGSLGLWSRLMARTIPGDENGFIQPSVLRKFIRKIKDVQAPKTTILCLENPTCEGRIYPPDVLNQLIEIGKSENFHVHLDGARIFHATMVLKTDVKQMTKNCDTVMFCLSKGLGAPFGSMVVGSKQVVEKIRTIRKRIGGLLRKPGMVAQSCHISLDNIDNFIGKANESAQYLAGEMKRLDWIEIVFSVDINMVFFRFVDPQTNKQKNLKKMDLKGLQNHLLSKKIKVPISPNYADVNRMVTHHYIGKNQIDILISAMKQFYEKSS